MSSYNDILEIPVSVLAYLRSDGPMFVPDDTCPTDDIEADANDVVLPTEFKKSIQDSLKRFNYKVFPKLNWSSPKDARWIACGNTLACSSIEDIFLLLKASDRISHDLHEPFEGCLSPPDVTSLTYYLTLRTWTDMHPQHEFRCLIKDRSLVGVCPRHTGHKQQNYGADEIRDIVANISCFFNQHIKSTFPLSNYMMDVYRPKHDVVYLVDLGPVGEHMTSPLLPWSEYCEITTTCTHTDQQQQEATPVFRCAQSEVYIQPSDTPTCGLPLDIVHLSTGHDPYKLADLLGNSTFAQAQYNGNGCDHVTSSDDEIT